LTPGRLFSTRSTVAVLTPAASAIWVMVTEVAKCGKRLNKSIRSVADLPALAHRAIPGLAAFAWQRHEVLGFALIDLFIAIFNLPSNSFCGTRRRPYHPTQEMST
jgi:hypothetical protein